MKTILLQREVAENKVVNTVSHRKAVAMVTKQIVATKNKIILNFYTKEMLIDMLNTPGCEGINFYFGLSDDGKNTLIAIPATANKQNVKVVTKDGSIRTTDKLMVGDGQGCPTA